MASVTICPEDRDFRKVLLGDASLELEMDLARHMTGCERCASRMHSALSNEQTRKAIQKRGEDRPLWQFYSDASKLTGSAATVRRDDAVEATQHLPKDPSKSPSKEMPLASGGDEAPATMQLAASIYSFLSPPETKDEIGRLGGYCVTKLLGAGGMGMVFQAEDLQLRRKVALKVMRPEVAMITNAHDRFLREARTMAQIEHDHVVAVFQVGEERGVPFMAMPFLQGMPLDTVLKKNPSIPLMISLRMGFQIANGLAAAHSRGLIHRDIKPANIWIETQNNNRVKLLDFGLARGNDEEINLTQSGAVLGTPAYMAPEQAAGGPIDARADLFSLGVVLYELTAGRRPFAGAGTMAILTALAIHNPPPPHEVNPSIPENVSAFIMRLLEKDPEKRVSSAQEAAKELASLIKAKAAEPKESPIANDTVGGGNLNLPTIKAIPRHKELSPPTRSVPVAAPIADASGTKRRNLLLAAIGGGVLGLLVITFAVITIFMRTAYGTLEVQIDDPSIEARFKNGSLVLTDDTGKVRYTLRPAAELADKNEKIEAGNYKLRVEGADGLTVETDTFSLKNGKREIVKVILKPNATSIAVEANNDKAAESVSDGFVSIFNGVDLTGWTPMRSPKIDQHEPTTGGWAARDGQLVCDTAGSGWLRFDQPQGDFELELEVQVPKGKNSGILIRHSGLGALYREGGMEIQIEDDPTQTKPNQKIGSIYGAVAAKENVLRRGEWNRLTVLCDGERVAVTLNGVSVVDAKMNETPSLKDLPRKGYIGIYNPFGQGNGTSFRNLRLRNLPAPGATRSTSSPDAADRTGVATAATSTMSSNEIAKWVLESGGELALWSNGNFLKPTKPQEIPGGAFTFAEVSWKESRQPADISSLTSLTELGHLSLCIPAEGEAFLKRAELHANIDQLYLSGQQLSEGGSTLSDKALTGLKNWKGLKGLSLNKGALTGSGLATLLEIPSLKKLLIYQWDMNSVGLAALNNNANLEEFSIQLCPMTDAGFAAVAALPNLKVLKLDCDQITDRGLAALAEAKTLKSLELVNSKKITDSALQRLQQALPELKIQREGALWMGK